MSERGPSGTGHDMARAAPFLTTTVYYVWFRDDPGNTFRLWESNLVEQHHANARAKSVLRSPAASPRREVRVARRTTTVEWLNA